MISDPKRTSVNKMAHMSEMTHMDRMARLRELIRKLRHVAATEGHMLYVLDAIDMIVDELEDQHDRGQPSP